MKNQTKKPATGALTPSKPQWRGERRFYCRAVGCRFNSYWYSYEKESTCSRCGGSNVGWYPVESRPTNIDLIKTLEPKPQWEEEFIERGADLEHDRWARWHRYSRLMATPQNIEMWDRKAEMPYVALTDKEQESDRKEARNYLPLIRQQVATLLLGKIKIERIWAMPNKWTFKIKPIAELLREEVIGDLWADPFSGENGHKYASFTNDIERGGMDALQYLKMVASKNIDGVLYDPPYSITQARQYGKKEFSSMKYWADCKNEIARIVKPGGKAICFGWNSMGLGKNRGFEMKRILLIAHGGSKNDTIVTVERKL